MARRSPPRKVTYFEPVAPCLARNTIRIHLRGRPPIPLHDARIDCGQLDPAAGDPAGTR